MKVRNARQTFLNCALLIALAVFLAATASSGSRQAESRKSGAQRVFQIEPAQSKVHWTLGTTLHTVHGTFVLNHGDLRIAFEDTKASGEIVVDAQSGESGNDSRDKKMHGEILESRKFSTIVFHPDRIEGKIPSEGSADVQLHGVFSLHGSDHEITLPVHADVTGNHWKGNAKFTIPYIQWGLKNPSNFLLKTDPQVGIELELSGTVATDSGK
jgi:polyisoprenoid-binding protein YceI